MAQQARRPPAEQPSAANRLTGGASPDATARSLRALRAVSLEATSLWCICLQAFGCGLAKHLTVQRNTSWPPSWLVRCPRANRGIAMLPPYKWDAWGIWRGHGEASRPLASPSSRGPTSLRFAGGQSAGAPPLLHALATRLPAQRNLLS